MRLRSIPAQQRTNLPAGVQLTLFCLIQCHNAGGYISCVEANSYVYIIELKLCERGNVVTLCYTSAFQ